MNVHLNDLGYIQIDIDDILIEMEKKMAGERRRRTDEADGYYKPIGDEER